MCLSDLKLRDLANLWS